MKDCKYKLPCGYCDKYNVPCKATAEDLMNYNILQGEISAEEANEIKDMLKCNHEWQYSCYLVESGYEVQRCSKCGMTRQMKIEEL